MKKQISLLFLSISLFLFVLSGCVLPGTGTLRVRNEMTGGRVITNLYIYEAGSSQGSSVISSSIYPNETHTEYGIAPGSYIIEAEIDFGAETAIETKAIEEGTWHTLWIMDGDIL